MPFVSFDETVLEFIQSAYAEGWVDPNLAWPEWASSPKAVRLRDDPQALATAGIQELSSLLTLCIRRERFVEGSLLEDFNTGLILRIVQRASTLLATGSSETKV